MISNTEHPVSWAMLVYELSDANEHLADLITRMRADGVIDEIEYASQLGHVFAHLNRAWHCRNDSTLTDISAELHDERSRFPVDLLPVG